MKIKKTTLNNILIIFAIIIIVVITLAIAASQKTQPQDTTNSANTQAVTIEDSKQIINLTAKGGYTPSKITAEANQETTIKITTQNSFDCSSAFTIPELNITKSLPFTGVTEIPIGKFAKGKKLFLTCTMGMYTAKIIFN